MFFGGNTAARRARRRSNAPGARSRRPPGRTVALVTAASAGTGLVTFGGMAWATPETVATTHPVRVKQRAGMTYDAQAPRNAAYPTGQVRTGDPVFLRLVPTMDVQIGYRAELDAPASGITSWAATSLSGTRRVSAELRSKNGWHRGFELLPRTDFTGGGFDVVAPIDFEHVRSLVAGVEKSTGVTGGTYTLSIRSEIALKGTIPGPTTSTGRTTNTEVRESFFPELTFSYDIEQLQLAQVITAPVRSKADTNRSAGPVAEVAQSRISTLDLPGTTANHLGVLGRHLPLWPVRIGGLAAGLALLLAAGFAERARRAARRGTPDRIIRRIVLDDVDSSTRSVTSSRSSTSSRSGTSSRSAGLSRSTATLPSGTSSRSTVARSIAPSPGASSRSHTSSPANSSTRTGSSTPANSSTRTGSSTPANSSTRTGSSGRSVTAPPADEPEPSSAGLPQSRRSQLPSQESQPSVPGPRTAAQAKVFD